MIHFGGHRNDYRALVSKRLEGKSCSELLVIYGSAIIKWISKKKVEGVEWVHLA